MPVNISDRICRLSQPIKDSHQWTPSACSLRHHRAPALTVWQRAALRQSQLARCQHPSGVHHIRDTGASAAVSIQKYESILWGTPRLEIWWMLGFLCFLRILHFRQYCMCDFLWCLSLSISFSFSSHFRKTTAFHKSGFSGFNVHGVCGR